MKPFVSVEVLEEIQHSFSTNKCESMNAYITHFLPKNKYLQGTLAAEGRVCLAVCCDSVGFAESVDKILKQVGCHNHEVTEEALSLVDKRAEYLSNYIKRSEVKKEEQKELLKK